MNKLTLGIVAAFFSVSANASWSIVELGTINGNSTYPDSINDLGQITGYYFDKTYNQRAFITDPMGENIRDIIPFATGGYYRGTDINNSGIVAGDILVVEPFVGSKTHPFITGTNGDGMKSIEINIGGPVGGATASGINNSGQVTGHFLSRDHRGHISYVTDTEGNITNSIISPNYSHTISTAINNSGQVAGHVTSLLNKERAFITNDNGSGIRELGTLDDNIYKSSVATDINELGQVVGSSYSDYDMHSHAFITGEDGVGMMHMGVLKGYAYSRAVAINDDGIAVGISSNGWGMNGESFIYANGSLTSLLSIPEVADFGWKDIYVTDINNNGQIIGYGFLENDPGNRHSFLLSFTSDTVFTPSDFYIPPVPEPSTYLMLLAGLGLLGFMRKNAA